MFPLKYQANIVKLLNINTLNVFQMKLFIIANEGTLKIASYLTLL